MPDGAGHAPLIYVGEDAPGALIDYARQAGLAHLTLVADANTHGALARRVEERLRDAGVAADTVLAPGPEPVVADEHRLVHVLLGGPPRETAYVGVGSGTVTDLARFASFRSRNRFLSLPTAASMDGYATSNNTISLAGLKVSVSGQAPEAIFCDLPTLAAAPRAMTAAGLGDTLAKFTSVNDLRLGHVIWGERADTWPVDEPIAARMERLAQTAMVRAGEIAADEPKARRSASRF